MILGTKNMRKTESPKNGVKTALSPLFKELSAIHIFFAKNTNVNQRKSKNYEELNFTRGKVQKYEKN